MTVIKIIIDPGGPTLCGSRANLHLNKPGADRRKKLCFTYFYFIL